MVVAVFAVEKPTKIAVEDPAARNSLPSVAKKLAVALPSLRKLVGAEYPAVKAAEL